MNTITLTSDQQNALDAFNSFIIDPIETVFLLSGYSGTGKTTLVKHILNQLPDFMKAAKLIQPKLMEYNIELTATTNKAAEAFHQLTGRSVATIHSYLGLRVATDYATNTTTLIPRNGDRKENTLIFIDEASYVDAALLSFIFKLTHRCKIVFIGDPAQLTPVKSQGTPVFDAHFTGAHLSQVVRQAEGNPIVDLSTKFRNTVTTGEFFKFTPDGNAIMYLDREAFNEAVQTEFMRPDWKFQDSKVLGWTNKCAIGYNHAVRDHVKGLPEFGVGDYAVCNSYIASGRQVLKTDQMVQITDIGPDTDEYGVPGNTYTIDGTMVFFSPKSLEAKNERIKTAKAAGDSHIVERIDTKWIDLRAAYACTINKAQGSTFDRVYIDLDDISRCNSGDQIARMLYVGVSRAKQQVYLTGDFI